METALQPPYGMAARRCAIYRSEASRSGEQGVHQPGMLVEKLAGDPYQQTDGRAQHGLQLNNQQPGLACLAVPRLHDSQPGLPKIHKYWAGRLLATNVVRGQLRLERL